MEYNSLYRKLLRKSKRIDPKKELEYIKIYQNSSNQTIKNQIADLIIFSHRPFVYSQAMLYARGNTELSHDLLSEGNIGMLYAIQTYNFSYRQSFLSWARYYITKYILDYLKIEYKHIPIDIKRIDNQDESNEAILQEYDIKTANNNIIYQILNTSDLRILLFDLYKKTQLSTTEIDMLNLKYGINYNNRLILYNYTEDEIAKLYKTNNKSVKKIIHKALIKLQTYAKTNSIFIRNV